eukprot:c12682_g1_i1.p2 GENE.c12682_g1_i1~~c12682_g1_i1.p2  ORF type:complete len:146 (-),score=30.01 c12682_g1_i1:47-484(-)
MTRQGVTVKDVSAEAFIKEYAAHLKKSGKIELPAWHNVVKTAKFKELAPYDPDWYYTRAASIARKVYLRQNTGVGALRDVYGGPERRGVRPVHHQVSSGGLIRKILQDLEGLGVITKSTKGRKITAEGQRSLDNIASKIVNGGAD